MSFWSKLNGVCPNYASKGTLLLWRKWPSYNYKLCSTSFSKIFTVKSWRLRMITQYLCISVVLDHGLSFQSYPVHSNTSCLVVKVCNIRSKGGNMRSGLKTIHFVKQVFSSTSIVPLCFMLLESRQVRFEKNTGVAAGKNVFIWIYQVQIFNHLRLWAVAISYFALCLQLLNIRVIFTLRLTNSSKINWRQCLVVFIQAYLILALVKYYCVPAKCCM